MRAVVIYESMYMNTHLIADAIGEGMRESLDVVVVPVDGADTALAVGADAVIVGGPTHAHSMSRASTRAAALEAAAKDDSLSVDPSAEGPGVRDWLQGKEPLGVPAAAFDTRLDARAWLTGKASKRIARDLARRGCSVLADPESFLVTKENELEPGEVERARRWGADLGARLVSTGGSPADGS